MKPTALFLSIALVALVSAALCPFAVTVVPSPSD